MRKEVLVAIFLGIILGLLVVGGIWWNSKGSQKNSEVIVPEEEQESTLENKDEDKEAFPQQQKSAIFLGINYPEEGAIIDTEEVKVSGETIPGAVVVLIYPEGETIITANDKGLFEGTVVLTGGANEIKVSAYDHQGNKKEALLTIVYSTAKL